MKHNSERSAIYLLLITALLPGLQAVSLSPATDMPIGNSFGTRVPKWTNGVLMTVQYDDTVNPLIWLFEGTNKRMVPFTMPGARRMLIYDWNRGAEGTIGLSGEAIDAEGRGSFFIAWISRDENTSGIIRTGLYVPKWVAVAPDGTLWAAGRETASDKSSFPVPNAGLIRHFSQSGETLGTFVPQHTNTIIGAILSPENWLQVSKDRVAFCLVGARYIEVSLDGRLLTDISMSSPTLGLTGQVTGGAVTDNGNVFLSAWYRPATNGSPVTTAGVYILNRTSRAWQPVLHRTHVVGNTVTDDIGTIYGVEGEKLVMSGIGRVRFFEIRE